MASTTDTSGDSPIAGSITPQGEPPPPTRRELSLYAAGTATSSLGGGVIASLQNPIFNMVLGVSPGLLGTVAAICRLWDAFTDPVMGYFSDRADTRWGRRRPFILVGAVLMAVVLAVFFQVKSDWSSKTILAWYLCLSLAFFTASTIFLVPYYALGIEIATDYDQRTRVVAYRSFVDKIVGISREWMFRFCELFSSTLLGAKVLAVLVGIIGMGAAFTTVASTQERVRTTAMRNQLRGESLFQAVRNVLSNHVYRRLLLIWTILTLNNGFFTSLGVYLNVYYIYGGDRAKGATLSGVVGTLGLVLTILAIPLTTALCKKMGKHRVLRMAIWLYIFGSILKWWCVNPDYPYLQLILPFFFGIGISSIYLVMSSMQADIVDYDELLHGGRREGMFSAVGGWIMKLGFALALMMAGWIIVFTGFDVKFGGEQADGVFLKMRILFSLAPVAGCIIALFCLRNYPLTRARIEEIHQQLDARRTDSSHG
jgi:GPH family glycoside/pentoside/hexuronide:cation symporter